MSKTELHRIAETLDQFPFAKKLAVEVCSHCNLECIMCHQPTMLRPKGVMPFELWQKCADEVAEIAPDTECWFSFCGEPLLVPELLLEMVSYGKGKGLKSLNLNTNGMLLTPNLAEPILDSGLDLVVFGIDGLSASTYEKIRVGGERSTLFSNIEHLLAERSKRESAPEIQVQFIEMDENRHEANDFEAYWLERGATVKLRKQLSWGGRLESPLGVPAHDRIPCPWVINLMHVFWDGRVPRCSGDTEGNYCVGNAWDEQLLTLWQKIFPFRQTHLDRDFDKLPMQCQQCKDWMTGVADRVRPDGHMSA